ncbi:uncharacterized protein F5891DRAFT_1198753 [Suillus fuscotomentosus]|uniref:Uncharacterized protein n=1 Tax=Suillus fuscotomentosus TaxID=1912939 RepID=A0AAD4HDU8_9AGAM|nr:uncharacterized protein F5891DRAFT_1198753 [Suillus fuscotomentosus]KAG1889096.1 hypothetical protein F5891DRAFT_1198753 [Suillus fuscotomentosus]
MPSTTVSNKAPEDAAARVQQLVAQAMQLKNGPAGHFMMAMEITKNLSPVFEPHGRSASMISPLLLSAAMELQSHLDPVTHQSCISIPIWGNIIMDDRHIEKHPLYRKALKFIASSSPSPLSHPPVQPAEAVIDNATEDPPVASKPKPKPNHIHKKTLKVMDSSESDGIKIIDHVVATNTAPPDIRKGSSKHTVSQDQSDETTLVEILQGNTIVVRERPMPKQKQIQAAGGCELKPAGKEVPPQVDSADGHSSTQLRRKRSRDSSQNEQVTKSTPSATRPPVSADTGDQCKPWFEHPIPLPTTDTSKEDEKDLSPAATSDIVKGMEDIQPNTEYIGSDDHVTGIRDAGSMRHSLPPITTVSARSSLESSAVTMHAVMPPRRSHPPPSRTEVMDVDVPTDAVVKDLQAMTLQVRNDSALLSHNHEDFHSTIDDLCNQVAELRVCNAAAANSLDALNVHVAAQDAEMKTMERLHANVAMLQEQVRVLHAESRTHENQLRAADVKLASQGSTTAVLQDAYESLQQCLIPTPSIPPHYNNAVFFPGSSHQTPYSHGPSVSQAQAMERLYFNFTPGPSTATGPSVATASAGARLAGDMDATPGPSAAAGASISSRMDAPSGGRMSRSSQSNDTPGASASGSCHN